MGIRKPLTQADRRHWEGRKELVRKAGTPCEHALPYIAISLVEMNCRHETAGAKVRYAKDIEQWLRDEGDYTPERVTYWIDVILDKNGEEPLLDAFFHVLRSVDKAATHSILQSLNQAVEREQVALSA